MTAATILLPVICADCGAVALIDVTDAQGWTHDARGYHRPKCSEAE
jgi:hypothetical protein